MNVLLYVTRYVKTQQFSMWYDISWFAVDGYWFKITFGLSKANRHSSLHLAHWCWNLSTWDLLASSSTEAWILLGSLLSTDSAMVVLSTNFHRSKSSTSRSLIITKNNHGPGLVPWGTPAATVRLTCISRSRWLRIRRSSLETPTSWESDSNGNKFGPRTVVFISRHRIRPLALLQLTHTKTWKRLTALYVAETCRQLNPGCTVKFLARKLYYMPTLDIILHWIQCQCRSDLVLA